MKRLEEIELEYDNLEVDCSVCEEKNDLIHDIMVSFNDLESDKLEIIKIMKETSKNKLLDKLKSLIDIFFIDGKEYYEEELKLIDELLDLVLIYKYYLTKILEVVDENNYKDLYKLFYYTIEINYEENYAYVENKRQKNYANNRGIEFRGEYDKESIESFREFFSKKIKEIQKKEHLEKKEYRRIK